MVNTDNFCVTNNQMCQVIYSNVKENNLMKMNFSNVKEFEFSLLPVGNYLANVRAVKEVTSSNGNPMWNLQFCILEEDYDGRIVFGRIVWTEGALPFAKQMLAGFAPILELDLTDEIEVEADDLIGLEVMVQVSQETNTSNGKLINVVKATMPVDTYETA